MSLRDDLENLWSNTDCWYRGSIPDDEYPKGNIFVKDWPLEDDTYSKQNFKILFITKEPHITKAEFDRYYGHGNTCDLLDDFRLFIKNKKVSNWYWINITNWAYALFCIKDGKDCSFDEINDSIRIETMKKIAIMNLKKSDGFTNTDTWDFLNWFSEIEVDSDDLKKKKSEYNKLTKKQIELLNPDLIVCCGDGVLDIVKDVLYKDSFLNVTSSRETSIYKVPSNQIASAPIVFPFFHPSYKIRRILSFNKICGIFKDILNC